MSEFLAAGKARKAIIILMSWGMGRVWMSVCNYIVGGGV